MKKLYFLSLLVFFTLIMNAKTIYVSTTGNDASGDGTNLNPYKTLFKGVGMVSANNDMVMLAPGIYNETVQCNLTAYDQVISGESAANTIIDFTGLAIGIYVHNYENIYTIKDLTLKNGGNASSTAGGGAIWMHATTSLVLENVKLTDNFGKGTGGAICFYGKSISINNCYFNNNKVFSSGNAFGGALFIQGFANNVDVSIANSTFYNNTSEKFGGAITFWKVSGTLDNVLIKNCNFFENKALDAANNWTGGAINFQSVPASQINTTLVNNTFYNNTSGNGTSVTTLLAQGAQTHLTMVNNVITNSSGVGVTCYVLDGSAPYTTGKNNIIRTIGGGLEAADFATNATNNNYVVWDNPMVTGVSINNSLTDNSTGSIFRVPFLSTLTGSTTINAGLDTYGSPNIIPVTDIKGVSTFATKDIGAYEFGGVFTLNPSTSTDIFNVTVSNRAIHIQSKDFESSQIKVYNVSGICKYALISKNCSTTLNIVERGIYLVKIDTKEKSFTYKVMVY